MHNRTANIAIRTITAPQDVTSADPQSLVPRAAVGICPVLMVVVVVFVVDLFSRRYHEGALTVPVKGTGSMPKQKVDAHASSEWWLRTQWALEVTVSKNEVLNEYGLKMLGALAKSEMADTKEKAMLDAAWQGSSTGMQDDAIDQHIEDASELKNPSESPEASPCSLDNDVEDTSAPAGRTATTYRRRCDPTSKEQVFGTLRREILTARLKVALDERLGRET